MAIKYYYKPSTKETFAVLEGCKMDVVNKIEKYMSAFGCILCNKKYLMPESFRAKVKLAAGDVDNPVEARAFAKQKVMAKYYKALDKRMAMFEADLAELNGKVFTYDGEYKV